MVKLGFSGLLEGVSIQVLEAIVALRTAGLAEHLISVVAQSGERSLDLQGPEFLCLCGSFTRLFYCTAMLHPPIFRHQAPIAQYNTALFFFHSNFSPTATTSPRTEFTSIAMKHKYIGNQPLCKPSVSEKVLFSYSWKLASVIEHTTFLNVHFLRSSGCVLFKESEHYFSVKEHRESSRRTFANSTINISIFRAIARLYGV